MSHVQSCSVSSWQSLYRRFPFGFYVDYFLFSYLPRKSNVNVPSAQGYPLFCASICCWGAGCAACPGSLRTALKIFTEIHPHRATLPNTHAVAEPLPSNLPPSHKRGLGRPSRIQVETVPQTQNQGAIFLASQPS